MNKTRILKKASFTLILLVMFFSLFLKIEVITANGVGPTQRFNTNFALTEFSKFNDSIHNANSINFSLPSSSWSIQNIELNFTDIKFGIENNTIEDRHYGQSYELYHQNINFKRFCVGVQIQLNVSTTIYGVFIYANISGTTDDIIQVQLRGYDHAHDAPNNTIYSSTNFNVDTTAGWYFQNFSTPVLLPAGNYFLALNGTNIPNGGTDNYYWYYNNLNPKNPNLNVSEYINPPWSDGVPGNVPLYKLVQRVNTSLYPEKINMTVNINDQFYSIFNKMSEGEGYLPKTVVTFSPVSTNYQISVYNNVTKSLFFNVSYSLTLSNNFNTPCSVVVQEGTTNRWNLRPTIIRQPTNYSVLFNYPSNWENISVMRDEVNITSSIIIETTSHNIILLNDTITDGADWEIVAYTLNVEFELNIQRTEYTLGQEIEFLFQTNLSGTYTFVLLNSAGVPVKNQTIPYPPATIISHNINSTDLEGIYTLYVFFFSASETNAGVQSRAFEISPYQPPQPPPEFPLPLIILIIVLGAVALGLVSYIALKKIRSTQRSKLEKFLNKCTDVSIINDVIVIDTKSGVDVFSQSFGGRDLDTSLISGFLQAISNFGSTISEAAKESRTMTIEYKDSIVMQTDFVNLKLIITLKENPSSNFKFIMEDLAYDIYKHYGDEIDKFTGILKPFHNMHEIIEKHLNTSFLHPLKIVETPKIKLSASEKEMIGKARTFMKENSFKYFYSLYLMPANTFTPKDYETIFNLIEKGVFQPTEKDN